MIQFKTFAKGARKVILDNSPTILTAISVAGVVTTAVLSAKAAPTAVRYIQEAESEFTDPITVPQKIKLTWKCYIPAASMGAATIACIISANTVSTKRNAAIMSAYSLTETAFKEYREKVTETIGKTKEQSVRDDIMKDRVDNDPVSNREVIITGNGEVLCYDSITGRYFESTVETIRKAQNDLNAQIINDMYASQNEFYRLLGLQGTKLGDELGWNHDNMLELSFTSVISEDGRPCLALDYRVAPVQNYYKIW